MQRKQSISERVARTTALPGPVARSLEVCSELTASRAGSFYRAIRLTPAPKRPGMYALYAWSREADDIADESPTPDEVRAGLAEFSRKTAAAFAGVAPGDDTTIWPAFTWAVGEYGLERRVCEDLIEGMRREADGVRLTTFAEFDEYCYRVAGTVGVLCVRIWGVRAAADPSLVRRLAERRGRALQTINVLRDFAADFDRVPRRVYIPSELFTRCGLVDEGLRSWRDPMRCEAVVRELAARARSDLAESQPLHALVERSCAPVLEAMTTVYACLLGALERHPRRVLDQPPVSVAVWRKALIAATAVSRSWLTRWRPGSAT